MIRPCHRFHGRYGLGALLTALFAPACGPRDAGFGDVRTLVAERTAGEIRWNHVESAPDPGGDEASDLLSAPLTVESAVRIALIRSPELRATFEELGLASAALISSVRPRNPTASGDVQFDSAQSTTHIELGLTQSISDLFYAQSRRSIAELDLASTKLRVAGAVLDLAFEVKDGFYAHQAAEQVLEMRRTVVDAVQAGYDLARRLHAAGNITDLDLDVERALYEDARLQLSRAEVSVAESREALNVRLGIAGNDAGWTITSRLPEPSPEETPVDGLETQAIERSLALASLRHRLEAAAARVGLARVEGVIPNVELGIEVEGEVGDNAPPLPIGPTFELTLPLWDRGEGRVLAAEAELRRLRESYRAQAIELRAEVRAARARTESTRRRALHLRDIVLPLRARIVGETQLQHNAMQVGLFQLLEAKRGQIEAGREYVETLASHWRSRAELDLLLAGGLSSKIRPRAGGEERIEGVERMDRRPH